MRRQLVPPGLVVRLTVIKAKTRPGIEAICSLAPQFHQRLLRRMLQVPGAVVHIPGITGSDPVGPIYKKVMPLKTLQPKKCSPSSLQQPCGVVVGKGIRSSFGVTIWQ